MKKMYQVEIRLEWKSPENNSKENDVIAFCAFESDAELIYNRRIELAEKGNEEFETAGGYKTAFVCLRDVDGQILLKKSF